MNINASLRFLAIAGAFLSAKSALAQNSFPQRQTLVANDTLKTQFSGVNSPPGSTNVDAQAPQTQEFRQDIDNSQAAAPLSSGAAISSPSSFDRQQQHESLVDKQPTPQNDRLPQSETTPAEIATTSSSQAPTQSQPSKDASGIQPTQTNVFSSDVSTLGGNTQTSSVPDGVEPPEYSVPILVPPPLSQIIKTQSVKKLSRFVKTKATPIVAVPTFTPRTNVTPISATPPLAAKKTILPVVTIPSTPTQTASTPFVKPPAYIGTPIVAVPTFTPRTNVTPTSAASTLAPKTTILPVVTIPSTPVKTASTPFVKPPAYIGTPIVAVPTFTPKPNVTPPTSGTLPTSVAPTLAPVTTILPVVTIPISSPKTAAMPTVKPPALISSNPNESNSETIYPLLRPASVTSRYGWRTHPLTGTRRFHSGIDIAAPTGTPVVATSSGTVVSAGWNKGYGKEIVIEHDGNRQTLYGHLSEISVQAGQSIERGTVIGKVGSTGNSTGPHLHFEKRVPKDDDWVAIDPTEEIQYAVENLRRSLPSFAQKNLPAGL
jgi:hypothetical protein